ncbi:unnamed protein product [Cladocopium goreaui]|uniref:Sodium channel protein type 11 subunit alpha n=1 Tax=Cladocopium goreaui TaxID=2562237 RepID=A0A9P1DNT0_9DINO|nr:unnamed protein product [Cladocopium goreaui]
MDSADWKAIHHYLQAEFGILRQELSDIGQKLGNARWDTEKMSKDVFQRRVSNAVMKLERSDSMHRPVTPVTRRISLSVVSPRLSPPPQIVHVEHETENDNCNFDEKEMKETENQLTRFDSEVESVNEVETEIQPVITGDGFPHEPVIGDLVGTPSLPGSMPSESKDILTKKNSKKWEQASQRWADSMEGSQQKLNLFEHKKETADAFGRGMGLVSRAEDAKQEKSFSSNFHRRCYKVVTSNYFELLTIFLISSSALQIGLSTNWMAENLVDTTSSEHRIIEVIYCIIFTAELMLRLTAYRLAFFTQVGWAWNVFDLLLVGVQLLEELLMALSSGGDGAGTVQGTVGALQQMSPTTLLRIARVLRAVRVLRILRIALMAEDLRLLVSCLLYCSKPFFWTAVLLGLMIYIVAIYLTQIVLVYRVEGDIGVSLSLEPYFGSVPQSMLSLFQGMTGGIDWENMVTPVFRDISTLAGSMLVLFMAFAILGVMNVVTGTFVQNAICRAEEVKDMQRAMKARRLFKSLDDDETGQISFKEILNHTKDREVLAFFRDLDIEPSEAKFLFDMLDINQSGSIDFEEFLNGCIRLQGSAKAIDMLVVTRETRLAFEQLSGHMRRFQAELSILTEKLMGWKRQES